MFTEREEANGRTLKRYLSALKLDRVTIVRAETYDGSGSSLINIDNKHWVVVWIDHRGRKYYFDSGGHPPPKKWNICRWNRLKLQPKGTRCCGWYCLWFLLHVRYGIPVDSLIRRPRVLHRFIKRLFRLP